MGVWVSTSAPRWVGFTAFNTARVWGGRRVWAGRGKGWGHWSSRGAKINAPRTPHTRPRRCLSPGLPAVVQAAWVWLPYVTPHAILASHFLLGIIAVSDFDVPWIIIASLIYISDGRCVMDVLKGGKESGWKGAGLEWYGKWEFGCGLIFYCLSPRYIWYL